MKVSMEISICSLTKEPFENLHNCKMNYDLTMNDYELINNKLVMDNEGIGS